MAKDVGNTLKTATKINLSDRRQVLRNSVGGNDPEDYYRVTLKSRSRFSLVMDKLKRNADVQLLDRQGKVLQTSALRGKRSEAIDRTLDSGTYYVRSFSNKSNTRYRLILTATSIQSGDPSSLPLPLANLPKIKLTPVATGLIEPTFVTNAGDGSDRLFVTEKAGKIQIIENGKPKVFLDISDRVSTASEQGLASVAFPLSYSTTRRFYVDYTNKNGDIVISRFQTSATNPNDAIEASEQILLTIPHPGAQNHYGGQLAFDANNYLYISTGDGGGGGDPNGNAQNPQSLLGKILRLDVESPSANPYAIPSTNPFGAASDPQNNVRDEIWSLGLRNPWRFSIDAPTGNLYTADVGQNRYEEINFQPGSAGGQNYGWNLLEGNTPYPDDSKVVNKTGLTPPVFVYDRDEGRSITGGYVYRGNAIAGLQGTYVYGDFVSGKVWGLRQTSAGTWENQLLVDSPYLISTFGQDEKNNLYLTNFSSDSDKGVIYRIDVA
ncbi:MAG: PQQ-dependent sugar dehydrogenase [Timaviella obliquedivisa GSE-PSE-MK23-08B]|jgi:glucose/arabinose dehydrogenase|nr:PQQ-dependent sugar dehydrogenase [Timaviella obliquedivisa GSE-PSE-MK23-08B]